MILLPLMARAHGILTPTIGNITEGVHKYENNI
jgi:hypothetical protein